MRKEYHGVSGTNVAVQNLTFGVQAATCFGLLGVNGAGKSTTFKMLTTETLPTDGRLFFRDTSIGRGPLCNGDVGYCPQWDALDGFLTPHQTLTVHGQVCGLLDVSRVKLTKLLSKYSRVIHIHIIAQSTQYSYQIGFICAVFNVNKSKLTITLQAVTHKLTVIISDGIKYS